MMRGIRKSPHQEPSEGGMLTIMTTAPAYIGCRTWAYRPDAIAPTLLATAILLEVMSVPPSLWVNRLIGITNARICLVAIPLMSTASLIALLFALREGAPRSPTVSGAAAGLLAGTMSASLYATHCPDDSPFFVLTWYCMGISIVNRRRNRQSHAAMVKRM
jgi:hypothetical protein